MSAASQKDAELRAAEKVLVRARALKAAGNYAAAQGEFFEAGSYLQGTMAFETHKSGQDAIKKKLLEIIMEGEECKIYVCACHKPSQYLCPQCLCLVSKICQSGYLR